MASVASNNLACGILDPVYLGESTWANRAVSPPNNARQFMSDVGPYGTDMRYDTTRGLWVPVGGGDLTLFKVGGIPIGIPPTHTMGDNGAITLGTALNHAFPECYMYFSTDQIAVGVPAGLYYTTMSNTTQGIVYNNTYIGGIPATPTVLVPFVTTGPGSNTGVTAEVTVFSDTFPGGLVGPNAQARTTIGLELPSNTNSKQFFEKIGGQTYGNNDVVAATGVFVRLQTHIFFQGSAARQTSTARGAFGSATPNRRTVDLSSDQIYTLSVQKAVAADYLFLAGLLFEVFP